MRVQFSLRTFLIFVVLVAGLFGLFGAWRHRLWSISARHELAIQQLGQDFYLFEHPKSKGNPDWLTVLARDWVHCKADHKVIAIVMKNHEGSVRNQDVSKLKNLSGLTRASFRVHTITRSLARDVAATKELKSLTIASDEVESGALAIIGAIPTLVELRCFVKSNEYGGFFEAIRHHPNLRTLQLFEMELSTDQADAIGTLARLETLELTRVSLGGRQSEMFRQMPQLRELAIYFHLQSTVLENMRSLNLKCIRLKCSSEGFPAGMFRVLAGMQQLEEIHLHGAGELSRAEIDDIARIESLKILWASDARVSEEDLLSLAALRQLREVVCESEICEQAMDKFRKTLPTCKLLVHAKNPLLREE